MDRADGLPKGGTEAGPGAGGEVGAVATTAVLLGHPVAFDVLERTERRVTEVAGEAPEHGVAPLRQGRSGEAPTVVTFQEADEDAGRAVGR